MDTEKKPSGRCRGIASALKQKPCAIAAVKGSVHYPALHGTVQFYQTEYGVIVFAEVFGLPTPMTYCQSPVFAFHIHSGSRCGGNSDDPFAEAMTHYNPSGCDHPYHAGDMPPLFGCNGYAWSTFLTNRFTVSEIVGRTVIIHSRPDDFTTQPSGNSGEKIACGQIRPLC